MEAGRLPEMRFFLMRISCERAAAGKCGFLPGDLTPDGLP